MAQIDPEVKRIYETIQGHLQQLRELEVAKTKHVEALNRLGGQRNENELVKQELTHLEPDAAVFKLIGPVLVSQDADDARHVVERRLEHIAAEYGRTEKLIEETERKEDEQREKVVALQKAMQTRQAQLEQPAPPS
jgi:prefoldin beta subunit